MKFNYTQSTIFLQLTWTWIHFVVNEISQHKFHVKLGTCSCKSGPAADESWKLNVQLQAIPHFTFHDTRAAVECWKTRQKTQKNHHFQLNSTFFSLSGAFPKHKKPLFVMKWNFFCSINSSHIRPTHNILLYSLNCTCYTFAGWLNSLERASKEQRITISHNFRMIKCSRAFWVDSVVLIFTHRKCWGSPLQPPRGVNLIFDDMRAHWSLRLNFVDFFSFITLGEQLQKRSTKCTYISSWGLEQICEPTRPNYRVNWENITFIFMLPRSYVWSC